MPERVLFHEVQGDGLLNVEDVTPGADLDGAFERRHCARIAYDAFYYFIGLFVYLFDEWVLDYFFVVG